MSAIEEAAKSFRARLMANDREAAKALAAAYEPVRLRLKESVDRLTKQMAEARSAGEEVSQAWLFRQERLRTLQRQVEGEIAQYTATAQAKTQFEQFRAAVDAQSDGALLAEEAGVGLRWNTLPVNQVQAVVGVLQDGSPLRALFEDFGTDASARVSKALIVGVSLGQGPREIALGVRVALNVPLKRALTIARTETLRAYRSASIQSYRENEDVVDGWIWFAHLSGRTCAACLAMHGSFHRLSEEFGSHPNCFPAGTVIQSPPIEASTSRWYEGEIIEVETLSGNRFAVTPNHPILTSKGWVAAGLLHEGGDVIRALNAESILRAVNPYHDDIPTRIEEVAKSFRRAGGMVSATMPTSPEDFHCDGGNSEVDIVFPNSLLRRGIQAAFQKPFLEQQFVGRHSLLSFLSCLRAVQERLFGIALSSSGLLCGFCVGNMLFGSPRGREKPVGLFRGADRRLMTQQYSTDNGSRNSSLLTDRFFRYASDIGGDYSRLINRRLGAIISKSDSVLDQNAVDDFEGDAKTASEIRAALSRFIAADEIVKVGRVPFWGHVYNLQTAENWYIANNIIAHNCRCVPVPRVEGLGAIDSGADWFAAQDEAVQDAVLGEKAAEAYRAGEVSLDDFVGVSRSERWGVSRQAVGLETARANAEARKRKAA